MRGELLDEDILALRVAHDEFLRTRQGRCTGQVHRVDSVEQTRQAILGGQ
jgi:hypothetical protein